MLQSQVEADPCIQVNRIMPGNVAETLSGVEPLTLGLKAQALTTQQGRHSGLRLVSRRRLYLRECLM